MRKTGLKVGDVVLCTNGFHPALRDGEKYIVKCVLRILPHGSKKTCGTIVKVEPQQPFLVEEKSKQSREWWSPTRFEAVK